MINTIEYNEYESFYKKVVDYWKQNDVSVKAMDLMVNDQNIDYRMVHLYALEVFFINNFRMTPGNLTYCRSWIFHRILK